MRARTLAATLGALLLTAQTAAVGAQTPEPEPRTPEMEQRAAELSAQFPQALGGASLLDQLEVDVGRELIAELDPSDPDDAEEIADIHELMEAAGATIDDATTGVSFVELGDDSFGFVAAYQIRGTDAQQTLPLFVAAFREGLTESRAEQDRIADRDVTVLYNDELPDIEPLVLWSSGDTVWLVSAPERYLEEAVGSFPEP